MKVFFLGVGEACDPARLNTSILVENKNETEWYYILLDCGFTTPHRYFETNNDSDRLDALWISHFHGDHFFGVPLMLLRFWEMGRRKKLVILGPVGVQEKVEQALDLAYPGFGARLQYPVVFRAMDPGISCEEAGCRWTVAASEHSRPSLALRLDGQDGSLFYSGDGRPTPESLALAVGCQLVIHESYNVEHEVPGHGSVEGSLAFAAAAGVGHLALVHVSRTERGAKEKIITEKIERARQVQAVMPVPGDVMEFSRQ